jgi:hypothetical protein
MGQNWLKIRVGAVFAHILALGYDDFKGLKWSASIKKRMKLLLKLQGHLQRGIQ